MLGGYRMFEYEVKNGVTALHTEFGVLTVSPNPSLGYKPIELLISSIIGCSSGIFSKVLEKKRMVVYKIQIKANIERNEQEANRVTRIHLHYIIEGKNILEEQIQKSLDVTFKNCGMIQTVKDCIEINKSFDIVNRS